MVITLSSGRSVKLHFVHSSHDFGLDENGFVRPVASGLRLAFDADARNVGRRLTLCEIAEVGYNSSSDRTNDTESYYLLGQGVAVCHPTDSFRKTTGRKVALGNAMKAAELNKTERGEVWAAYRSQFPA